MKKHKKTGLIAAGIAVGSAATLGTLYFATAGQLMHLALDREEPELFRRERDKFMHSEPFCELAKAMEGAAETLENAGCEEVVIAGRDGVPLVGHWRGCEDARRVIVAMHGWRSSWALDFGAIADFWHDSRCCVLYAEQRGQGESGGDCMGFGLPERFDCLDWVQWVNERTGGALPLYLAGVSMGAATVLMAAGSPLPDNVRGIMADCGYTSPGAIWKHVAEKNLHIPYGLYKAIADETCRKKLRTKADTYSCPEAMARCTVPVLFIHGTDDRLVPIEMTYENYKACVSEKRLFVVPGADHGMCYLTDTPGYERVVREFWRDHDRAQGDVEI